jgi:hypothetical protein
MDNFKADILEVADPEPIEAIVIGEYGWGGYGDDDDNPRIPKDKIGVVLTWDEAAPLLDYEYYTGYGAPECHAIAAYTASRIIYVSQYDGSTNVMWSNRNPQPHMPSMPGGS